MPPNHQEMTSILEILELRAQTQSEQRCYTFLGNGETESGSLTYRELDRQARVIASHLQSYRRERAVLLYHSGLEFIAAFFGCLYAGVVAVPVYPPRRNQKLSRLLSIINDAQAKLALTTTAILSNLEQKSVEQTELAQLTFVATDAIVANGEELVLSSVTPETLAFLQYTSGSTGTPKGVMVTHGNIIHNQQLIHEAFCHSEKTIFAGWLPLFHDMGLIGNVLQPMYLGIPCILMPPVAFLQKPIRWLQMISKYRATTSGGPNFAYHLCVKKVAAEELGELDLRSWDVAFNGAEPVRAETLEQFSEKFAECGFNYNAFYPCYGMAETTLLTTGGEKTQSPVVQRVKAEELEQNWAVESESGTPESRTLVGCGHPYQDTKVVIVNPKLLTPCAERQIGEIWVSGLSIAQGYWRKPEETEQTFYNYLADTGEGPFLRTGDLGFLHNGELFITGRCKDLIIIRGRNHYPQDIELTVEQSHHTLRFGCGVAFSVEIEGEERLIVAQEIERTYLQNLDVHDVVRAIRQAVSEKHELQVYAVLLLKTGSILKTSSGKIQRHSCRASFLAGSLDVLGSSILERFDAIGNERSLFRETLLVSRPEEGQLLLQDYLQDLVSRALKIDPGQLDTQQPLTSLGIDSLMAVELQHRLEANLKIVLPMTRFLQGANIKQLAKEGLEQVITSPIKPICPAPRNTSLPLSFSQQRLWFLNQLEGASATYNIAVALNIVGLLNIFALEQSLTEIVRRHEILRTTFPLINGLPVQEIGCPTTVALPKVDLCGLSAVEKSAQVQRLVAQEAQKPFDLAYGPLLRVTLLRLETQEHILLLTMHHIVSDGWSRGIFIQELSTLYKAFSKGEPSPLPDLPIQYADFAYWQHQWLQGEVLETQLKYWRKQLSGTPSVLNLPTDRPRPPIQTFRGSTEHFEISPDLTQQLKTLSKQSGTTLFMTLLAAFKTLIYRYTEQETIIVGTDIANRNRVETELLIGFFVNQLVLRTDLSGNLSFRKLLGRVTEVTTGAYANQDIPFQKLVQEMHSVRDLGCTPLFQVKFILQKSLHEAVELPELKLKASIVDSGVAQFDFILCMEEVSEALAGSAIYSTDLFDASTITWMIKHFQNLLKSIVANPDLSIKDLNLLTSADTGGYSPSDFPDAELSQKDFESLVIELTSTTIS